MVSSLFLLAGWMVHVAAVAVTGTTACPTPEAVQQLVASMVDAEAPEASAPRRASLSQTPRGLLVSLRAPDGAVLAEKQFIGAAACSDLASAAAVVIATWEGELAGETDLTLQALPREPQVTGPLERPWVWRLGAAAAVTRAGSSLAPGLWLDASVGRGGIVNGLLAVFIEGAHERGLGVGQAVWQRSGLGLGPRLLWQAKHVWLGADLLTYAAWLRLSGEGQPQNVKDHGLDAGLSAAVRAGWQMGAWSPYLSLGVSRSFVSRTFAVEPVGEAHMPATLLALMAGFSWRL